MESVVESQSTGVECDPAEPLPRHKSLEKQLRQLAELLPPQGPITAFAFLNTLQALEGLPFDQGLVQGARLYQAKPYYTEEKYHDFLVHGRIRHADLTAELNGVYGLETSSAIGPQGTLGEMQLAMLRYPPRQATDSELKWLIAEADSLLRFRREIPEGIRVRVVDATKRHLLNEQSVALYDSGAPQNRRTPAQGDEPVKQVLAKLERNASESWTVERWEALTLEYLWRVCNWGVRNHRGQVPVQHPSRGRYRDTVLDATGIDTDLMVNEVLVRFTAPFVDQGQADWVMPCRQEGYLQCFFRLFSSSNSTAVDWMRVVGEEIRRLESGQVTALQLIEESLGKLGVGEEEQEEYLRSSMLAIRGWAGMIWQLETRPDRVAFPVRPGTFIEFMAVRLLLDRLASEHVIRQAFQWEEPLASVREKIEARSAGKVSGQSLMQRTFLLFQVSQACGWTPESLERLSVVAWQELLSAVDQFNSMARRRIFHKAYERRYRHWILDAFKVRLEQRAVEVQRPRFQAVFCLDAREESFRRHLEEVVPDVETFGTAGFYGVPMYFKGIGDAHFAALCPVVIKPQHWVTEEVVRSFAQSHARRIQARKTLGTVSHRAIVGSRELASGALLTTSVGVLATAPLVARVLFPRLTARFFRRATELVSTPVRDTRLRLERSLDPPGKEGEHIGFSLEEMCGMAERALRDIGLVKNFARLVMIFGHGSSCLNNPHASCYDCGACSGRAGAPNARALAYMLNDARVRERLRGQGIAIPASTFFVGGFHNTGSDSVSVLDADLVPQSHFADLEQALSSLEEACERNAHEKCRRFQLAPLGISPAKAREHVEERCEDLAQTRPEYGNCTNALCFVGRRSRIRGLFLDRRAFLMSYDPETDDEEGTILARILGAVVPVCSGINLQYTLSALDNIAFGCGSKLPHNITSLLGVMEGAASDLRPGLPWQGVDIHEPMRILFILETTEEKILKIMSRNEAVSKILRNGWAQLALVDPAGSAIRYFSGAEFSDYVPESTELSRVRRSIDWYSGSRDHLQCALIEDGLVSLSTGGQDA